MEIRTRGEDNWFNKETGEDVAIEENSKEKVAKTRDDFKTEKDWYIYCLNTTKSRDDIYGQVVFELKLKYPTALID